MSPNEGFGLTFVGLNMAAIMEAGCKTVVVLKGMDADAASASADLLALVNFGTGGGGRAISSTTVISAISAATSGGTSLGLATGGISSGSLDTVDSVDMIYNLIDVKEVTQKKRNNKTNQHSTVANYPFKA